MADFDKIIETELLKRVSEKTKVNLLTETNSIMSVRGLSCLCHSSLAIYVQKSFMMCNLDFKYELAPSRNGVKITSLSKSDKSYNEDILKECDFIDKNTAIFLHNQFDNVDILNIAKIYNSLINIYGVNYFIELNESVINKICRSGCDLTSSQIRETFNNIKKFGYCIQKNNTVYWKMYKPDVDISKNDIEIFFTVMSKKETVQKTEKENTAEKVIKEKEFSTLDAINLIAKELGLASIEKTQSKIEEILAITNELIENLNSMQDWEKLMNWDKFILDWKMIMGDALNDRN